VRFFPEGGIRLLVGQDQEEKTVYPVRLQHVVDNQTVICPGQCVEFGAFSQGNREDRKRSQDGPA